eukprot:TRINITY_DN67396_c12_g5_i1.p1 TRINITY_DN67396_c12_g5~~TRINITY_DN67396_c12_g5_i1.p1  ORF type:complete len:418 (-),score=15.63 TRINITY_DN67396_c12_g5_i1:364-1617(-)
MLSAKEMRRWKIQLMNNKVWFIIATLIVSVLIFVFYSRESITPPEGAAHLTLIESKVAACLDGSPPGFYYRPGHENGAKKWIIFLRGGAWCFSEPDCAERSTTQLGSSKHWPKWFVPPIDGLGSSDGSRNPDFWNWNLAVVQYCDGSSFSSHRSRSFTVGNKDVLFRGADILEAVFSTLEVQHNLNKSEDIIFAGCSAGGLGVILHLDWVAERYPDTKVRGLADAGYFFPYKHPDTFLDPFGANLGAAVRHFNVSVPLGTSYTCWLVYYATDQQWRCFLPRYLLPHIRTPLFLLQSQVDSWHVRHLADIQCVVKDLPKPEETHCTHDVIGGRMQKFAEEFNDEITSVLADSPHVSYVVTSCYAHCMSGLDYQSDLWREKLNTIDDNAMPTWLNRKFSTWYKTGEMVKQVESVSPHAC